jgi:FKBP-type peptidyl-prolyl cis-trans isomerase FklB
MKKFKSLLFILSITAIIISTISCGPGKMYSRAKLNSKEDTVSYYLGMTYGTSMKTANVDKVFNYQAFVKGVQEAINSDSLSVSDYEIQSYLSTFFTDYQEVQLKEQYKDYITENETFLQENSKKDSVVTLPSGVQYKIIKATNGKMPADTDMVKVNYTGELIDGTKFDSSVDRGEPAVFMVNEVIPGWSEVVKLMPVGSKWRVWIPSDLAYGSEAPQGSAILPYSTLVFDIELLEINPKE